MHDFADLHTLVINALDEQIAVIDQDGTIIDVNAAWIRFGRDNGLTGESRGLNYLKSIGAAVESGDEIAAKIYDGMSEVLGGSRVSFNFEYPCHSPDEKRWFMMRVVSLAHTSERLFAVSHHNITKRKLAEQRAEHLSLHDPVTELPNRRYFNRFLDNELRRRSRERAWCSLMSIDLDNFKDYNDELGHMAGDQYLAAVGQVLANLAQRPSDLAARVGGDEFAIIMGGTGVAGSQKIAEAVLEGVRALGSDCGPSKRLQSSVSIGVASVIPVDGVTEELLHVVDRALYRAKAAGRSRVERGTIGSQSGN